MFLSLCLYISLYVCVCAVVSARAGASLTSSAERAAPGAQQVAAGDLPARRGRARGLGDRLLRARPAAARAHRRGRIRLRLQGARTRACVCESFCTAADRPLRRSSGAEEPLR